MEYDSARCRLLAAVAAGMALLAFPAAAAMRCPPHTAPVTARGHSSCKAAPAVRPKPQPVAPAGRHAAGSVWTTHAFSENVWTQHAPRQKATLLGRAASSGQARARGRSGGQPFHSPEAVNRWQAGADCLVLGDSIAVGVAQARPECSASARSGISSGTYSLELLRPARARTVVISLGVNDDASVDTVANLRVVRAAVHGERVIWLLPGIKERARTAIRLVAREFGDRTLDTRSEAGRDHLHPTGAGYEVIATWTRGGRPES
jgi:hypothetical protein